LDQAVIAAYSDVVGTVALVIALLGLVFTWWSRTHEPEHQVAIRDALERSAEAKRLVPQLRSDVIGALQFIYEKPELPANVRMRKEAARLRALESTWNATKTNFNDPKLREAMKALDLSDEIEWLESNPMGLDVELRSRLDSLALRLQAVTACLDATQSG
jgi:hypothetical protein